MTPYPERLAKKLVRGELFDLTLYRRLAVFADDDTKKLLNHLIEMEEGHFAFWKRFFNSDEVHLTAVAWMRLHLLILFCRIFREAGIHLVLEAIEVFGIKQYLSVWQYYKDDALGVAVRGVLEDEFRHESDIVKQTVKRKIRPERIRNIFLGLNDGLVEVVGAISGFFAAFQTISSVLIAGVTVAVAGALSMAAGSYVAMSSENEVERTTRAKETFLGEEGDGEDGPTPYAASISIGVSYSIGALVPLTPLLFGVESVVYSIIAAAITLIMVSSILSFLSGMDMKKRILLNLVILAGAVLVTYAIGLATRELFGVVV